MRVSRIQAAENRQTVINVASRLFRERGFDGIGLKDLMEGAGLTQGAFYCPESEVQRTPNRLEDSGLSSFWRIGYGSTLWSAGA